MCYHDDVKKPSLLIYRRRTMFHSDSVLWQRWRKELDWLLWL